MGKRRQTTGDLNEGTCDHCGGNAVRQDGDVLRCACGSLLAKHVLNGIELKCRRCKRTVLVSAEAMETARPT